jgi:hypothetical protein
MKRLVCRWVEYYLALCEDDIEPGLPGWVRWHKQSCARCQAEADAYRRAREAVRRYAQLLPDAPVEGWQPLQVRAERKRRVFPLQVALAPVAVAAVAVMGFVVWQRSSAPVDDRVGQTQLAQIAQPSQQEAVERTEKVVAPSAKGTQRKQNPPTQRVVPEPNRPAPSLRQAPSLPVHRPPKRILVAAQPLAQTAPETETQPAVESLPEVEVPVQPILVEASPPPTRDIPEACVVQPAYAAAAGGVE